MFPHCHGNSFLPNKWHIQTEYSQLPQVITVRKENQGKCTTDSPNVPEKRVQINGIHLCCINI